MATTVNTVVNESNHIRTDYTVDDIWVSYPNQQKKMRFVNGTALERIIPAGTLVGVPAADQTLAKELASAAIDGSQIPFGFTLNEITIAAGAAEETEALVGHGDNRSLIFEDKIVLAGADTLDTVITDKGMSIRNAIIAFTLIKIEKAALNVSDFKDSQV